MITFGSWTAVAVPTSRGLAQGHECTVFDGRVIGGLRRTAGGFYRAWAVVGRFTTGTGPFFSPLDATAWIVEQHRSAS